MIKIYFAGAIRGERDDVALYQRLIAHLNTHGNVLTEHVGDVDVELREERETDCAIHARDMTWLFAADVVIAEVTQPSLGVGYEIGRAVEHHKPILCLYRPQQGMKLSAMIASNRQLVVKEYHSFSEAKAIIDSYMQEIF